MADKVIYINVNVSTLDEAEAARAIDTFARMVLGLALEGLEAQLEVSTASLEEMEEEEIEQEGE